MWMKGLTLHFGRAILVKTLKNKRKEAGTMTTNMNNKMKFNIVDERMEIQQTFCLSL